MKSQHGSRYFAWWYVIVWIIQAVVPFTLMDVDVNPHMRAWVESNRRGIDPSRLHHANLHDYLAEVYAATKARMIQGISSIVSRPMNAFCLLIDLWTSKTSGDKYLGELHAEIAPLPRNQNEIAPEPHNQK